MRGGVVGVGVGVGCSGFGVGTTGITGSGFLV